MIQPYQIPNSMTAEDAIEAAFVKLKRQYQNRIWSDDDLSVMNQQLDMYRPEWILSACDELIGDDSEFYSVGRFKKYCEQYAYNERMANLYNEPDPFADNVAKALTGRATNVNAKLLRVQIAWMMEQSANGETPKKIPFDFEMHRKLVENISEFDGVPQSQLAGKVRQLCG